MTFDSRSEQGTTQLRCDIAIVGMSCLFAGMPDLDSYFRNIISKVDAISDPPIEEWDPKLFYDPTSKANDRVYCKRGGYIGDLAQFRPSDFGIMPIAVDGGEPDQWLSLRVAHEALADAGYTDSPKEHMKTEVILGKGTYVNRGNLTVGYHGMIIELFLQALKNLHPEYTDSDISEIKKELKASLPPFSADTAPALIGNIVAGRIANRLDLMGPSFTVDAACASAMLAIDIGIRSLVSGKCDLVIAGGVNANVPLPTLSLFCQLGALSRREQIRPFDKDADGTILGEGLGMIVLKRREDAERDGNRIYALLKGVGIASDGRAVHVMAPRVEGEELALQRAYEMAGFSPRTVGLVEAHGTATPVGDAVEIQALGRVFGERSGPQPGCAIGSVKSMIGHTMPAAGIAGVIKTALALYHRVVPPTLNCDEPNPALHLEKTPFYVNTETRPWIHGAETPRRAGVNSFGFGGINGHVVLEEYPEEAQGDRRDLVDWETEVFILETDSRQELIERGKRLRDYLMAADKVALKDIAYTLNCSLEGRPCRLAIVAESREDLIQKLSRATDRLADEKCKQIKDTKGIYFFDQPLQGKLAFIFPGEGAQYPNMLLDLCLHFPEVRSCFDLADRALTHGSRDCLPSDFIFPRSTMSAEDRSEMEKRIWEIDGAVESVLIANRAMWTLLNRLEIRPDVIMGHSTGDYSAMLASGVIELTNESDYIETILTWNQTHARLEKQMQVPDAVLVAVAADSATVQSIADGIGGDIYLAMDNCPHQNVLVGSKETIEAAIEQLRQRGLMYEVLPFDRPYHTEMFRDYAEGAAEEFFSRLRISAPKIETYSCTTTEIYPTSTEEIRELFIAHWVLPVLFSKTVEKMYADGVRHFVEVGPRGNLTSFVSDILRDKPHLAIPANLARRSGVTQINHMVGALAAQGVGMNPEYLYARRDPKMVSFDAEPVAPVKRPGSMKITLAMPPLKVTPRPPRPAVVAAPQNGAAAASTSAVSSQNLQMPQSDTLVPAAVHLVDTPVPAPVRQVEMPVAVATQMQPAPVFAATAVNARAVAMQEYMKGMETFLDVEQQVMKSFLLRARPAEISRSNGHVNGHVPARPAMPRRYPLLGTVTSLVPGQELTAVRQLTLEDDIFLRQHALGGPVAVTDPELRPLVVLPLTMSMELLAEAAAAVLPGKVLVGMRDIQAHHWIRVDDAPVDLQITARRVGSADEVEVQVRDVVTGGQKSAGPVPAAARGIMIFADSYPQAPTPLPSSLTSSQTSRLASAVLYDGRLMFHGPCFQGVASVDRTDRDNLVGQLQTLPPDNMFRALPDPGFVTDPVALDAAGQLVGFWAAEYLETGFVVFPYRLDRLSIYGPVPPSGKRLPCQVQLQLLGSERIRSEIEVMGADGRMWMQLHGWEDRRFDPPKRFHRAWTAPHEAMISEPWRTPLTGVPGAEGFECFQVKNLFEPGAALWTDLWASLILSRQERRLFAERQWVEKRKIEWLSGRTAAKDAVRAFLKRHYGLELLPADIEIVQDEHGKPSPRGAWTQQLRMIPELSLTHSNGTAAALVGEGNGQRFGIDIQQIRELASGFETMVFAADEQWLVASVPEASRTEWLLRLWCTKEAVAKALGRGLIEGPVSVRIVSLDLQTGVVRAEPKGKLVEEAPEAAGAELITYTAREGEYIIATAFLQKGKNHG